MGKTNAVGTMTTVVTKSKKTGGFFTYQVYEAACGGIFTAKLVKATGYDALSLADAQWSDPKDTAAEARYAAFMQWAAPMIARTKATEEYNRIYKSGHYR